MTSTFLVTWDELFRVVAPLMINEASEQTFREAVDKFIEDENLNSLSKEKDLRDFALEGFEVGEKDFQTIKVQLRALGLITKSEKSRSVKDVETYWTLTPYGDEVMTWLCAIRRTETSEKSAKGANKKPKKSVE